MTCQSLQIEALGLPAGFPWAGAQLAAQFPPSQLTDGAGGDPLAHISPPFLCVSSPEFLTHCGFYSPRVTLMFCCYEQTLAAKPKSIVSSVGREDPAAEEHLNSVPGSLYDLAKNVNIGPKWTGMRYWWLLLIRSRMLLHSSAPRMGATRKISINSSKGWKGYGGNSSEWCWSYGEKVFFDC